MLGLKHKQKESLYIWLTAVCFSIVLLIVVVLVSVIVINSIGHFWVNDLQLVELKNNEKILGKIKKKELNLQNEERLQFKVGNRDFYGFGFRWIDSKDIKSSKPAKDAYLVERIEYGDFYGYFSKESLQQLKENFTTIEEIQKRKNKTDEKINRLSFLIKDKELEIKKARYNNQNLDVIKELENEKKQQEKDFFQTQEEQNEFSEELAKFQVVLEEVNGEQKIILMEHIVRYYQPNKMSLWQKIKFYIKKSWEFLSGEPREANTEGGIFPIIFGTVILVLVMSVFCYPFGLAAAIYLHEYAKDNWLTKSVRIAVSNLAGVPSIVYGIFGLSFFIYGIGGFIDETFYPEKLPTPTFGTGGILWASLTLSVLTLPVVIVATEEALNAVPKGIKEGSLALGATTTQSLFRVCIPVALPGIITGFVLAIARAAGEVAPLLITGVVKLAPALPIDGNFPYFHLDRKFMHLGFHIFDIAFQSPNVEASRPVVFVSTLLLLLVVIFLCSFALILREKIRKKYKAHHI